MRATCVGKMFLLVVGLILTFSLSAPAEGEARVLLIFSYHAEYAWHVEEARGTEEVLQREGVSYEKLYLDTKRNTGDDWKEQVAAGAKQKIEEYAPSLVIVFDDNACTLVAKQYVGELLPFVFCGVNADPSVYGFPASNITGVLERPDFGASLELLRLLVPDVEKVAVITDASPSAEGFAESLEGLSLPVEIAEIFLTNDFDEWQAKVLELQSEVDAIGLFTYHTISRQGDEGSLPPEKILQWTIENNSIPEFATLDFTVEGGALCGVALSAYEQGKAAAEIAIRILAGERPSDIPVVIPQATRAIINAARAAEFGIEVSEDSLSGIELID